MRTEPPNRWFACIGAARRGQGRREAQRLREPCSATPTHARAREYGVLDLHPWELRVQRINSCTRVCESVSARRPHGVGVDFKVMCLVCEPRRWDGILLYERR